MPPSTQLERFIEDELARVPLLIEQVFQAVIDQTPRLATTSGMAAKKMAAELKHAVSTHRQTMVRAFCNTLREQVYAFVKQQTTAGDGGAASASRAPSLALVEDDAIAFDVELSRVIDTIGSVAEYELRELGAFTSALVGDMDVARDTNPFKPEAFARALGGAAETLPTAMAYRSALMREGGEPLAQALRKAYAAACTRLESHGVEPAMHRTIIVPIGGRTGRSLTPADLHALMEAMAAGLQVTPAALRPPTSTTTTAAPQPSSPTSTPTVDRQMIELLSQVFDAIAVDRSIPAELQLLLSRLHAPALRLALNEPKALGSYSHPLWQFMDRLVFDAERLAEDRDERERLLRLAQGLVDSLAANSGQDAGLYDWALSRLRAFEKHLLERSVRNVGSLIAELNALPLEAAEPAPAASHRKQPLDVATLDTVPAALMDYGHGAAGTDEQPRVPPLLPAPEPGQWLHVFLQGRWRNLQMLWMDPRSEVRLLHDSRTDESWALRHRALERLHAEGLAKPLAPRSLVRQAARALVKEMPGRS
ncbi:MAG TPA: DUF1631 family protein [Burkholderiaceae bacterium]|nr:DUF1631 family protein [Burkholderiaceae bacterium]